MPAEWLTLDELDPMQCDSQGKVMPLLFPQGCSFTDLSLLTDRRLKNQSLQQFGCKTDKISSQTKAAKTAKTEKLNACTSHTDECV